MIEKVHINESTVEMKKNILKIKTKKSQKHFFQQHRIFFIIIRKNFNIDRKKPQTAEKKQKN